MSVRSRGPLLALGLASVGALSIASTAGAGTTVPSDDTTAATTGDTAAAADDTTAATTGDTTNPLETPFEIGEVPEDMSIVYVPGPDRQPVLQHGGVRRREPGRGARHRVHLPGRPDVRRRPPVRRSSAP